MNNTKSQGTQSPSTSGWRTAITAYRKQYEELSNDEFALGKFKLRYRLGEEQLSFIETLYWVDEDHDLKDIADEQIELLYKEDKKWWNQLIACAASMARADSIEQIKKESIKAYVNFCVLNEAMSSYVCALNNANFRLRWSEQPVEGLCENAVIAWKKFLVSIGHVDAEKLYFEGLDRRKDHRKMLDSALAHHESKRK